MTNGRKGNIVACDETVTPGTWPRECFERGDYTVLETDGAISAITFASVPYQGHETDVAAYLGVPPDSGDPAPGVVLVHGGGGTAFREWAEMWVDRGYAAIAINLGGKNFDGERHDRSGPPHEHGAIFNHTAGWTDLWTFHAIAAVIRANSILRDLPGVDPGRIGVTGISWGGYLTCIVAGVDHRFACAVPVYGCGYLQEGSVDKWREAFDAMPEPDLRRWNEWCDPSSYLPSATLPMLFVNGTNDIAFPLDCYTKSARLPSAPVTMCVRLEMPHSHPDGWAPGEIAAFIDSHVRGGLVLPAISEMTLQGSEWSATVSGGVAPYRGRLLYTQDSGRWQNRKWHDVPVPVEENRVIGTVPDDATVWFLAVEDARGMYVSAFMQERTDHAS
jgi:dienelactone hydrolase